MAEEILVKEVLSSEKREAGRELLRRLDAAKLEVTAAYWIFNPEVGAWRLEFVSRLLRSRGPLWFYAHILSLLDDEPKLSHLIDFSDINVHGTNYSFYRELVSRIKIEGEVEVLEVRLNRVMVGGQLVDLLIYRI